MLQQRQSNVFGPAGVLRHLVVDQRRIELGRVGGDPQSRDDSAPGNGRSGERSVRGQQQQHAEQQHEHRDQSIQDTPRTRVPKDRLQQACAVARAGKPGHAGQTRTSCKCPASCARVMRRQAAERDHRVEIDVRVEEGQRQAGEHGALPVFFALLRRHHCATFTPGTACGCSPIYRQKRSARVTQQLQQARPLLHQYTEPGNTEQYQRDIPNSAARHSQPDVLALETLRQHERVLRADHDDSVRHCATLLSPVCVAADKDYLLDTALLQLR